MTLPYKARMIIGWSLIAYLVLHIILNLDPVKVFFLFANFQMPVAFVIVFSAAVGAGAVFVFQFMRAKKEEKKEDEEEKPPEEKKEES